MAWIIDRDYIVEPGDTTTSRVGVGQWGSEGDIEKGKPETPYRFRMRDGDGEIYYGGAYDKAAVTECGPEDDEWGGLYMALAWAQADAGATDLQVKLDEYIEACDMDPASETVTKFMLPHVKDGWYSVYG